METNPKNAKIGFITLKRVTCTLLMIANWRILTWKMLPEFIVPPSRSWFSFDDVLGSVGEYVQQGQGGTQRLIMSIDPVSFQWAAMATWLFLELKGGTLVVRVPTRP